MRHTQYTLLRKPASDTLAQPAVVPGTCPERSADTLSANAAMTRYAQGDDTAFKELYQLLWPRLYRHCLSLAGPNDAEELLQEVFFKVHRARATFVDSGSVFAWTFTIARTTYRDWIRYRARRHEVTVEQWQLDQHPANELAGPERASSQRALQVEVVRELDLLSDSLRDAYLLVRIDGLSCADASATLGVSVDAVKQRVHRATRALKASLSELIEAA